MGKTEFGPKTSASLLLRIRDQGDTDSWHTFTTIYSPVIRAYCRRRGFQLADVDDITQEVLAAVAKAIENFEYEPARGKFRSWLATVTANKLRTYAAKLSKNEQAIGFIDELASSPEADAEWSSVFLEKVFAAACERVRPYFEDTTWACFEATWVRQRSAAEVAKEMDIPIHSVYVNKSRVLKRLEKEFLFLTDDLPMAE